MIDLIDERLITLKEAGKLFPSKKAGKVTNLATVYRWMNGGIDGVKLETIKVGGTRYTSHEALRRFIAAINGIPAVAKEPPSRLEERRPSRRMRRPLNPPERNRETNG